MPRLICCLTLLSLFFVHSPVATQPSRALSFTSSTLAARAAAPEEIVTLPYDTPVSGVVPPSSNRVCQLGPTQYAIHYPGGATRIKIEITEGTQLSFLARFGQPVAIENGQTRADAFGFGNVFYFPLTGPHLFEAGTYYIALRNCAPDAMSYSFQARLIGPTAADTAEITDETSFGVIPAAAPDSCSLAFTQYRVTTTRGEPCGGEVLVSISAKSDQDIKLYIRRDQRVAVENGQIVADIASTAPGRSQSFSVPQGGTFFVAIGNCSQATALYALTLFKIFADPPLSQAIINGCELERNPNGSFALNIVGANIKQGATVTVGGLTPKKVQFIELEPGSATSFRSIRVVKKICGGLPGNIVVTNPQPCSGPSLAFFCNEKCPN